MSFDTSEENLLSCFKNGYFFKILWWCHEPFNQVKCRWKNENDFWTFYQQKNLFKFVSFLTDQSLFDNFSLHFSVTYTDDRIWNVPLWFAKGWKLLQSGHIPQILKINLHYWLRSDGQSNHHYGIHLVLGKNLEIKGKMKVW